ncbi:MAG: TolC family protein [Muribaculaceae bacterium]|nr:TolC family protein [Muribaculaceae bacterium]
MTNKTIVKAALVAVMALGMQSCHIYNKFHMSADSQLQRDYVDASKSKIDSTAFGNMQWQKVFTDPVLAGMIDNALNNNKDLKNAKLNVDMAHAQMQGARLSYLPSVALAPNAASANYAASHTGWSSWGYQVPLAVSWEVDVFGKLLNGKRGAEASYKQSQAYEQAVRSQIIAGVANCYYSIAALERQLELQRATAVLWEKTVQTMADMKEAGNVNETAVVQSRANYYSILASITDLESSLVKANNSMSLLMNVMPQTWNISPEAVLAAPRIIREGVPMVELANRPDIKAAERAVAVAYYSTNSARAAFYPGLTITANGGFTNMLGSMVMNPGDWFIQLAGSLSAPLFARGQNIARLKTAKAQQKQAMNNFEYALMNASAEVSYAMTVWENSSEKINLLAVQVDNMSKSVEYTQELLLMGQATYLEVLTAQQGLLQAQMNFINCQLVGTQSVINLYQSLGGGR